MHHHHRFITRGEASDEDKNGVIVPSYETAEKIDGDDDGIRQQASNDNCMNMDTDSDEQTCFLDEFYLVGEEASVELIDVVENTNEWTQ
ncbi:hypothetical protein HN873_051223 [Arachis hypogaea]